MSKMRSVVGVGKEGEDVEARDLRGEGDGLPLPHREGRRHRDDAVGDWELGVVGRHLLGVGQEHREELLRAVRRLRTHAHADGVALRRGEVIAEEEVGLGGLRVAEGATDPVGQGRHHPRREPRVQIEGVLAEVPLVPAEPNVGDGLAVCLLVEHDIDGGGSPVLNDRHLHELRTQIDADDARGGSGAKQAREDEEGA